MRGGRGGAGLRGASSAFTASPPGGLRSPGPAPPLRRDSRVGAVARFSGSSGDPSPGAARRARKGARAPRGGGPRQMTPPTLPEEWRPRCRHGPRLGGYTSRVRWQRWEPCPGDPPRETLPGSSPARSVAERPGGGDTPGWALGPHAAGHPRCQVTPPARWPRTPAGGPCVLGPPPQPGPREALAHSPAPGARPSLRSAAASPALARLPRALVPRRRHRAASGGSWDVARTGVAAEAGDGARGRPPQSAGAAALAHSPGRAPPWPTVTRRLSPASKRREALRRHNTRDLKRRTLSERRPSKRASV